MNKIPYLLICFILIIAAPLQGQRCQPQGEWGIIGWQALNTLARNANNLFSRKSVNTAGDPAYERANEAFLRGDFQKARFGYTEALRLYRGNRDMLARVRYQRGVCNYILGAYKDAKADFNAAIRFRPDVPDAYYFRGKIYQAAMEQPYLAQRDFQRVLNMSKGSSIQKAFAHFYLGSYEQADVMMHRVLADARGDRRAYANALYNMAGLKAQMGEIEDACRYLHDALTSGFSEKAWMVRDINLRPIRHTSCYNEVLHGNGLQNETLMTFRQKEIPVAQILQHRHISAFKIWNLSIRAETTALRRRK